MIGPKFYGFDANGDILAYGKLYTYRTDTTDPKDTFTTENGDVANTNPVILNGSGWADVYLVGSYNMILHDENDVPIWSSDPVSENNLDEWSSCESATYASPDSLKASGNVTEVYDVGRSIRIEQGASFLYSTIVASSFAGGFTTIVIVDAIVTVSLVGVCASIVGANSTGGGYVSDLSTEAMLASTKSFSDSVLVKEYWTGSGFGSATWVKTGATGTPGQTDFENGLLVDGSGDQRKIQEIKITPAMFGAKADESSDDSAAIQLTLDYADITLFDRMYYVLNTTTLPKAPNGKTVEGVNGETSGITTLDGFAGDEKTVASITRTGASAVVACVGHGLITGDQIFIYGSGEGEYNGLFDGVTKINDDSFTIENIMIWPIAPASPSTGAKFFRKCKPVLTVKEDYDFENLTIGNFTINGAESVGSGCGNAIEFKYYAGMPNDSISLFMAKLYGLNLKAYGGAGAHLENTFACDIERLTSYSELHHAIYLDDDSSCTTFKNCNVTNAGPKKACVYSKRDLSTDGLNVSTTGNNATYGVYAGQSTAVGQDEDIVATVKIEGSNLEAAFKNHLLFPLFPKGKIENNTLHLVNANTDSFFLARNTSFSPASGVMLNANRYIKNGFEPIVYSYVLSFAGATSDEYPELFFVVNDPDEKSYLSEGSVAAFTIMQKSAIRSHSSIDESTGTTIDAVGSSLIKMSGSAVPRKFIVGDHSAGDRIKLYDPAGTTVLQQNDGASPQVDRINLKSLDDAILIADRIYEFEYRDSAWFQIDGNQNYIAPITMAIAGTKEITGIIPREYSIYELVVYGATGVTIYTLRYLVSAFSVDIIVQPATPYGITVDTKVVTGGDVLEITNTSGGELIFGYTLNRVS
jgi:hypothetical protein